MAYKDGKVYIDTENKIGIGIADISKAVGYASGDLGTLFTKGIINKYNIHKPVRSSKKEALTDEEFKSTDISLGFDTGSIIGQNIVEIMSNASTLKTWPYLRPRGIVYNDLGGIMIEERYRVLDFNGYDKNAVKPYTYTVPKNLVTYRPVGELKNTAHTLSINIDSASETPVTELGILTGGNYGYELSSWRYGIAYKKDGGEINFVYGNTLESTAERQDIDLTFSSTGSYEVCFIATQETGETSMQLPSVWLDGGFHKVSLSAIRIPIEVDLVTYNLTASMTFDDMGFVGITLYGLVDVHQYTLKRSSVYDNPSKPETDASGIDIVSTNGGLNVYVELFDNEDTLITDHSLNILGESFDYEGSDEETVSVDLVTDPILFTDEQIDSGKLDDISYMNIRITPYTNATDDDNGSFRWENGIIPEPYKVYITH